MEIEVDAYVIVSYAMISSEANVERKRHTLMSSRIIVPSNLQKLEKLLRAALFKEAH